VKACCDDKGRELASLREKQAHILKIVMAINIAMFVIEFSSGIFARSSALLADSLDMLGDAVVYGFSLYVLHKSETWRATAAFLKGLIITAFGLGVLVEALIKTLSDVVPVAGTMGIVGSLALFANTTCLLLLLRHRNDDLNMRSTWICSRNDIVANVGVLFAAIGVSVTGSKWPDVCVGLVIAAMFLRSAWPILTESISALKAERFHNKQILSPEIKK